MAYSLAAKTKWILITLCPNEMMDCPSGCLGCSVHGCGNVCVYTGEEPVVSTTLSEGKCISAT